ncbi:hypothetical protein D9M70_508680 [compost metagenome]
MFEQGLTRGRQLVAAGVLGEELRAEVALDVLDVPRHRCMSGVQALGCGEQAAAALQFEEEAQVVPVEHGSGPWQGKGRTLLEN